MAIINKPILDLVATGLNIKSLRKRAGISVHTLQEIFCFPSPQAIYNWESGKNMPSVDNLLVLSEIFGCTMENIIVTYEVDVEIGRKKSGSDLDIGAVA